MSKLEEYNKDVVAYIYEIIDLEKDDNHNIVYRIEGKERRLLSIRSTVKRKTDVVK